jgi:yecA family protein
MIALDQQAETTMIDLEVPVQGVALDALDAFLSSDQSPPDSMMLSDLDGFLTAIAIGPELVMPSEWLPVIWGDDEPVFTDEAEMQAVLGGILSRYNQIRHEIANGAFEPILWSDADGTVIGTDWAEGFMQGVGLRATKWERLFRSEDGAGLISLFSRCAATRMANLGSASSRRTKTALRPKQRHSCPAALWRSTITGAGKS